jgi:hypothetical protein
MIIRLEIDGWWRDEAGEAYGHTPYELLCTIIREFDFSTSSDPGGELESIITCIDAGTSIHIETEH